MPKTKRGENYTLQLIGNLYRGNTAKAQQALRSLSTTIPSDSQELDERYTLFKIDGQIEQCPYIDPPCVPTRELESPVAVSKKKSPYTDPELSQRELESQYQAPQVRAFQTASHYKGTADPSVFATGLVKPKKPSRSLIDLRKMSDAEIFENAIPMHNGQIISFSTIAYGGCTPNIQLSFTTIMANCCHSREKIDRIQDLLRPYGITVPNCENHTAESLVRYIANEINAKPMTTQEKEALAENILFHLTQILVGRSATPSDFLYAFKQQTPLGREYFNFGNRGFNIGTLFAFSEKTIPIDLYIKQGGADCRGANCLYAALLNFAYEGIAGSKKEARSLYIQDALALSVDCFESPDDETVMEDHNIVLVQDSSSQEHRIMDSRFDNYNNQPLREIINGKVVDGTILQLVGARRFPKEQCRPRIEQETTRKIRIRNVSSLGLALVASAGICLATCLC